MNLINWDMAFAKCPYDYGMLIEKNKDYNHEGLTIEIIMAEAAKRNKPVILHKVPQGVIIELRRDVCIRS